MRIGSIVVFILFLSGCTSQLWQSPRYEEKITGFYATEEQELLLVTGEKYSYVFEATDQLKNAVNISRQIEFNPFYTNFKVDEENNITGKLELMTYNAADKERLLELGYPKDEYGNINLTFNLTGKRYVVEGEYPFKKLEDDHYVMVEVPESGVVKAGKIIITPGAVAIDAVAIVPIGAFFGVLGVMNKYGS